MTPLLYDTSSTCALGCVCVCAGVCWPSEVASVASTVAGAYYHCQQCNACEGLMRIGVVAYLWPEVSAVGGCSTAASSNQQMGTDGEQANGVSGAASAIALALEHACAVLNGREANGRDPMALQYKGVY